MKASISRVPIDKQLLQSNQAQIGREEERRLASRYQHQFLRRGANMRTQVFFLTFALLAVLAQSSNRHHHHHSHVQSKGHGGGGELASRGKPVVRVWPCCDSCGGCTKSNPPRCQCLDAVPRGCHPACRNCVKSALSADPPVYQCMDRVPNFCARRCTEPAAAAAY